MKLDEKSRTRDTMDANSSIEVIRSVEEIEQNTPACAAGPRAFITVGLN